MKGVAGAMRGYTPTQKIKRFPLCRAKLISTAHCALWLPDSAAGFRGQKTTSIITSIITGLVEYNAGCLLSLQSCSLNPSVHSLQQNMAHLPNSHSLPSLPAGGGTPKSKHHTNLLQQTQMSSL